ncbi:glycosyltransferase family 4 protein [Solemya velum gill symbiont]|uniref:glycosyltransferase family 4 protein n=1 Tax=Solemya velum gill symbiont TaxID=2340 RepID=UPI000997AA5A|nr:glycosyltransferase family 4 protein [Solemya velum gill symbiont]
MKRRIKIGFITLFYPPIGGGGEIYLKRMIEALDQFDLSLWTLSPGSETFSQPKDDHYDIEYYGDSPHIDYTTLGHWFEEHYQDIFATILSWVNRSNCDLLILNSPITYFDETRELVDKLREKCPVGSILHDVPGESFSKLMESYDKCEDWEQSLADTHHERIHISKAREFGVFASPFQIGTDFTIYNSAWAREFYDPEGEMKNIIFHPLVKQTDEEPELDLNPVDFTIVNPLPMKGGALFLALANFHFRNDKIRILGGGYNSAMLQLEPYLRPVSSGFYHGKMNGNIEVLDYVSNMSEIYRNTRVLLHPTRIEGYGMTAAEALLENCLVVTTDIPGVIEGVGNAALQMPYFATPQEWSDAISDMIKNREEWKTRIAERVRLLKDRQAREVVELERFLAHIVQDS